MIDTMVTEERYCLACARNQVRVDLHLIADTAIGATIWEQGRLATMVTAPFNFDFTWYIWQSGMPRLQPPKVSLTHQIQRQSAQLMCRALRESDGAVLLKAVKLRYAAHLTGGYPLLPDRGELAKVYVRANAALYLFPAARKTKPKFTGAYFRVL